MPPPATIVYHYFLSILFGGKEINVYFCQRKGGNVSVFIPEYKI